VRRAFTGQIFVYSLNKSIPRAIGEVIHGGLRVNHVNVKAAWPKRHGTRPAADYYIITSSLTWRAEAAAADMMAVPVVLPEGHDWLAAEILRRSATQDLYLFHAKRQGDRIL